MPPAVERRGTLYRVILPGGSWNRAGNRGGKLRGRDVFAGRICSRLKNVVASSFAEVESV